MKYLYSFIPLLTVSYLPHPPCGIGELLIGKRGGGGIKWALSPKVGCTKEARCYQFCSNR